MSDFGAAIPVILVHEGGSRFTDIPGDKGGPTKWGLSLNRFWLGTDPDDFPQLGVKLSFPAPTTADDVRVLTQQQAEETYRLCWWERFRYGRVNDQRSSTKVFDMAVNMRRPVAHRLAQRAANDLGAHLALDGLLGDRTMAAINAVDGTQYLTALCHEHLAFYQELVAHDPTHNNQFKAGWFARAAWPFHPVVGLAGSA